MPTAVQAQVNADDRERNYDLAWQDIRALAGDIERGEFATLAEDSLLIASRMERLERGEAGSLAGWAVSSRVAQFEESNESRSAEDRVDRLAMLSKVLPEYFDPGDFAEAKNIALEIHVIARSLEQ